MIKTKLNSKKLKKLISEIAVTMVLAASLTACKKTEPVSAPAGTAPITEVTKSQDEVTSQAATETTPEPTTTQEETTTQAPVYVNLLAVGDMLLHGGIHNSALQPDGSYNYTHVFEHVVDEIQAADIAVANEEVILGGAELGISSYPSFNAPYDFGDALVDAGFDVILHATNHTMDKDTIGILNTINFWKTKHPDITVLGINETEEEYNTVQVVEYNGVRIAMLNYTYGTNGIPLPEGRPHIVNMLDETKIAADITAAKEISDFIVVYPHWGTEYNLDIDDSQKYWAQYFADCGADLVIGTHPHVVEPVEWVKGKNGNDTLVYYSLGNYISIQYYNYSMLGGMAKVTITKDSTGTYISDYDMDFLVTHYTAGRTEMTTYMLKDYTDELAARHAILVEPYQTAYADNYRNINSWYPLTVQGLNDLAKKICPEFCD